MNQHMQPIIALVRKDVLGLLPLIVLANLVFFVQPLIANLDILAFAADVEFWAVAQANFYWLAYFLAVLLMVSVLQLDPADSLTHDWLTRPIARTDWLLAKLLFMLMTIVLPIVLARFIINLGQDYGLVASLSYALAINNLPAVLPVPLLFAAALLAPNLRKTIFLLVLVFLVFLLPVLLAAVLPASAKSRAPGFLGQHCDRVLYRISAVVAVQLGPRYCHSSVAV